MGDTRLVRASHNGFLVRAQCITGNPAKRVPTGTYILLSAVAQRTIATSPTMALCFGICQLASITARRLSCPHGLLPGKILAIVDNCHKVVVTLLDPLYFLGSDLGTKLIPNAKVATSEATDIEPAHCIFYTIYVNGGVCRNWKMMIGVELRFKGFVSPAN